MTEREKMEKGLWYDANFDPEILKARERADSLCFAFNQTDPADHEKKEEILRELLPELGDQVTILSPLYADYGIYTKIGSGTFINHNAYLMDGGTITIGEHCFIGPNCGMYTAIHPLQAKSRNAGLEIAKPIVIEDNVWIAADVTILPGVTIHEGAVIGARSLVNHDVPPNTFAAGSPCREIRKIDQEEELLP